MAGAARRTHHQRHASLAVEHVGNLGGVVDQLVDADQQEVDGHDLADGPQAGHGRADAGADDPLFGDRGVDDPSVAELVDHPLAHLVRTAEGSDLFAKQKTGSSVPSPREAPRGALHGTSFQALPKRLPEG